MKLNQQHNDRCAGFEGFFLSTMVLESGPIEATANPKTPHARKTLSELRAHLGQIVLSAKDLGDLTEALDEALENCIFAEYVARVERRGRSRVRNTPSGPSLATLELRQKAFGADVAKRLHELDGKSAELLQLIAETRGHQVKASTPIRLIDMVQDVAFPLEMRSLALRFLRGTLARMTISMLLGDRKSPAFISGLVDIAFDGLAAGIKIMQADFDITRDEAREIWVAKTFAKAAEGDGYFAPSSTG